MAKKNPEIVLIGCGNIGMKHMDSLHGLGFKIVSVADTDYSRVPPEFPHRYDDPEECLAETADGRVVVIASPTANHAEQAIWAAKAGAKGIYVEKPPAVTLAEWKAVMEAVGDRPVAVGFNFRYHQAILDVIKPHMADPKPASVVIAANDNITTWNGFGANSYVRDPISGGCLLTSGSHSIDLLVHLFGKYGALAGTLTSDDHYVTEADNTILIRGYHVPSKSHSMIYISYVAPPFSIIAIMRETDSICISLLDEKYAYGRATMHAKCLDAFMNYVKTGRPGDQCTVDQAAHVMEVIDGTRKSWNDRCAINF
jgi:predicted dehydrogenase